ncbi:MAG: transcriptional repressor [Bacteroidota bacterium]
MLPHPELLRQVKDVFNAYLLQKGLRRTSERFVILEEIYKMSHFDSQQLYERMQERNYRVSRATIYNTLDLLQQCSLIRKHQFGHHSAIFEKSFHFQQHDHLICLDCKKIIEFCDPRLQLTQNLIEEISNFKIKKHSLTFFGHCQSSNCKKKKPI